MTVIIDRLLEKSSNTTLHSFILNAHRKMFPVPRHLIRAEGQAANELIYNALAGASPCLIGKLGTIELETIIAYLYKDTFMRPEERLWRYIAGEIRYKGWNPELLKKLSNNAGFFSNTEPYLSQFAELYLNILPEIDISHIWLRAERLIINHMPNTTFTRHGLAFYKHTNPWTRILEQKKILVIHPFEESIQQQYKVRDHLFKNKQTLPEFELITLKAINSAAGEKVPFESWFDALDSMKGLIEKNDFDIALIGAGAYSLPLGAHVKSLGKKAVHLGGDLQILFGIYGARHLNNPHLNAVINEHWIRPLESDKISNYKQIENGCYW